MGRNLAVFVCVVFLGLAGCISSTSEQCGDGRVCPTGTLCEPTHHLCVVSEQLTACSGLDDHDTCTFGEQSGVCIDTLCLTAVCGDGVLEGAEQCEGNDLNGVNGCTD